MFLGMTVVTLGDGPLGTQNESMDALALLVGRANKSKSQLSPRGCQGEQFGP